MIDLNFMEMVWLLEVEVEGEWTGQLERKPGEIEEGKVNHSRA